MTTRIILHIDMNSYFASVEQQANPFLRGKAVGVVATMTPNGCIIASSIEAKAKGIKTGVRVKDARAIDPQVILIPNDSAKYRSCTEGILRVFSRYTEDIEVYSIDEAFLDLTGWVSTFDQAAVIADEIRRRIQAEVGEWLKCSIGIAPTRWLAKFAGDTAPRGQTLIVHHDNLATTLDPRPLQDAWGIAGALEARLHQLNIYTLGDLRRSPVMKLLHPLKSMGYYLWANVNGIELPGATTPTNPKSIGHSHVFAKKAASIEYPRAILAKLCEKAGRRMRRLNLQASGLWLSFGLPDNFYGTHEHHGGTSHQSMRGGSGAERLPAPISDTRDIFQHCWRILIADLPAGRLPNFLAMGLFRLKPQVDQLDLWSYQPKKQNGATPRTGAERLVAGWPRGKKDPPALARALDGLNDRYGDFTVSRGNFWGLDQRDAPDRIGFRKSVDLQAITRETREMTPGPEW